MIITNLCGLFVELNFIINIILITEVLLKKDLLLMQQV